MPKYILMSTLTPDGSQTLHKIPTAWKLNKEIAASGYKVVAQYTVLGQCGFITLIDASDNENDGASVGYLVSREKGFRIPIETINHPNAVENSSHPQLTLLVGAETAFRLLTPRLPEKLVSLARTVCTA